jgi:tRNA (cytidine/uridine-2'-O-)-methyltransferase
MPFHVVLYQPENPHNTGAIIRTCALLGASLHLVKPYGFSGLDNDVRRSSMSYLGLGPIVEHESFEAFIGSCQDGARLYAMWDSGSIAYGEIDFAPGDYFVFGRESVGLPEDVLAQCQTVHIPMPGVIASRTDHREHSLNLSVSVAMTLAVATTASRR